MVEMFFDGFNWAAKAVTKFDTMHWNICFAVLLTVGFLCKRRLGVRGAR